MLLTIIQIDFELNILQSIHGYSRSWQATREKKQGSLLYSCEELAKLLHQKNDFVILLCTREAWKTNIVRRHNIVKG